MKTILRTTDLSHALGFKLALDAEGIEAVVSGMQLTGVVGNPFAVNVGDHDEIAARRVLAEFDTPPEAPDSGS